MRHRALFWSVAALAGFMLVIGATTLGPIEAHSGVCAPEMAASQQGQRSRESVKAGSISPQATNQPPTVTVKTPNGGESVEIGKTFNITWTADDPDGKDTITKFDLKLSTDGGASFPIAIASNVAGSSTSFTWLVSAPFTTFTAKVRVIVTDNQGATAQDDSDGSFALADNGVPVTLVSPNGGERVSFGQLATVSWSVSALNASRIAGYDLFYSTDSGANFTLQIAAGLGPGTTSFLWQVPPLCGTHVRVLVAATTLTGARTSDASNGDFTIENPGPTIDTSRMFLDPDAGQMHLYTLAPASSAEIPFLTGTLVEISTDEKGTDFVTFVKPARIKRLGRHLITRGTIDGKDLTEFFPIGDVRVLRVTNPACGVTQITVRRFAFQYFAQQ